MPNRIREWREKRGLTQQELAEAAETTPGNISRLETGTRGLSEDMIERLASALRCRKGDLLEDAPLAMSGQVPVIDVELFSRVITDVNAMIAELEKSGELDEPVSPQQRNEMIARIYGMRLSPEEAEKNVIRLFLRRR